jgi:ribosomal protein L11 methyltransferase
MPRFFPALDVAWPVAPSDDDVDQTLALVDDFAPTAVENFDRGVRIFFPSETTRDDARMILARLAPGLETETALVPDENWAERSQAAVTPVRVGRIVVAPPWAAEAARQQARDDDGSAAGARPASLVITIQPSMGFGTGHHASTRLCLALLQRLPLEGRSVIDIGTGSGVLAIAAVRLGAARTTGLDYDEDALASAAENVALNDVGDRVALRTGDIAREPAGPTCDVLLGNLTGGMLTRHAARLVAEVATGGALILSGFLAQERDDVVAAFAAAGGRLIDEVREEEWVAALLERAPASASPIAPRAR